jgi:hypothetical protein
MHHAMLDQRLLMHWRREQRTRRQARASLPATWRNDPRPEMAAVREAYVEGIVSMRRTTMPLRRDS